MNSGELANAVAAYHGGIQKVAEAYRLVQETLRKYQDAKFLADEKQIDPTIYATILASEAAVSKIAALMASYLDNAPEDPERVEERLKAGIEAMMREEADKFDPEAWPEFLG